MLVVVAVAVYSSLEELIPVLEYRLEILFILIIVHLIFVSKKDCTDINIS